MKILFQAISPEGVRVIKALGALLATLGSVGVGASTYSAYVINKAEEKGAAAIEQASQLQREFNSHKLEESDHHRQVLESVHNLSKDVHEMSVDQRALYKAVITKKKQPRLENDE